MDVSDSAVGVDPTSCAPLVGRVTPPGRSWLRATGLRTSVVLIMAAGGVLAVVAANWSYHRSWLIGLVLFVAVHRVAYRLSLLAGRLSVAAQRHRAPDGRAVIAADTRPPVLYLRAFTADEHTAVVGRLGSQMFRTEEQRLSWAFERVGPFVAIGRPGESPPPVGAARLYSDNAHWRDEVTQLVGRAAVVVIAAGSGAGLQWEIELVVRSHDPRRTVLLIPFGAAGYEDFRGRCGQLFPRSLPVEFPGRPHAEGVFTAAIWFDADWTGHLARFAEGTGHSVDLECLRLLGPVFRACGHSGTGEILAQKRTLARLSQLAFGVSTLLAIAVFIAVRA